MDRRAQASLAYTVVTDILAFTLVISALAVATMPGLTTSLLIQNVFTFAVIFAYLAGVWWRLSSMSANGIFWAKASFVFSTLLALSFVLLPLFLRQALPENPAHVLAAQAVPVCLALSEILQAIMIRQGHAYQTKSKWRLVHHSLWLSAGLFLLTLLLPHDQALANSIPVRTLAWLVILPIPKLLQRVGVRFVATPAQPPVTRAATSRPANVPDSLPNQEAENPAENAEAGSRPEGRRRRRGQRRYGGSRRRV
ncbi:MAG: hypothetical protein ONB48_08275 [candidate division KSB1 bacterium]|nr:hypothetical protein [candidate division KSB1 bacterium]MDZ7274817.1 hypothetical protein [candidate division KSB1 bacterium]MDZ7285642.1 hypothetical protein [candidate division KSB1 bacterium]MDZ7298674.1 hypothetical protein [candidate division KSB1 bacterium]MDZ7308787.1 hypothetical protein [candidate division KSB1 bacterium]